MSYISPRPEQSTDAEIAILSSLLLASPSGPGEFLYSPSPGVIANAVPAGGGGITGGSNQGGGAGIYMGVSGSTIQFRTLTSIDGSVIFDVTSNTIDLEVDETALDLGDMGGFLDLATQVDGDLDVTHLNGGTDADSDHYWRGDGVWAIPPGSGSGGLYRRVYNIASGATINTSLRSVFIGLLGGGGSGVTEAIARSPFRENVTVKRIDFHVNTNTVNEGTTFVLRKNGVDTAYSIVVPTTATGNFSFDCDEAYNTTDDFSIHAFISGTATGAISVKTDASQGANNMNVIVELSAGLGGGMDTREYQSSASFQQISDPALIDGTGKYVYSYWEGGNIDIDGLPFYDSVNVLRLVMRTAFSLPTGAPDTIKTGNAYIYKNGLSTGFSETLTFDNTVENYYAFDFSEPFSSTDKYSIRFDILSVVRVNASVIVGTFTAGEPVTQASSGVTATFVTQSGSYIIVEDADGIFDTGANPIVGGTSGASATNPASFSYARQTVTYYTIVGVSSGSALGVQTVTGEDVDNTDPFNPVVVPVVRNRKVTITSAELLDLHNTPVELIPAPGIGKFIELISYSASLTFNSTPYEWGNVTGNGNLGVFLYSQGATIGIDFPDYQAILFSVFDPSVPLACGILSSSQDCIKAGTPVASANAIASIDQSSCVENDPLMIAALGSLGSAPLVNGDSDLVLYLMYREVTL